MNKLDRTQILAYLRDNKKFLEEQFGVTKIGLCGSYARDEAGPDSDIDLIIEIKEEDFINRFFLREYLEKHFNKKVHVGYLMSVRQLIKQSIEEDLVYA